MSKSRTRAVVKKVNSAIKMLPIRHMLSAMIVMLMCVSPLKAQDASLRIMMVGDSITAGYGLGPGEGLVDQLNRALAGHQANIEILNAGVSGDTTAGGRARLGWSLADNPDAVILALGGNDLLRGIDPAESRRNLSAMLGMLAEAEIPVLLCGMVAMRNLGPEYEAAFNQIYPELAAEYQVQLYPFLLEGVALDPSLNQPDGIHPNQAGVAQMVGRMMPVLLDFGQQLSASR